MTPTPSKPTYTYTLDNGLHVVVRQDQRTPSICASLFHKVGTDHERPDQRGLAYLAGGATFKDKALEKQIGAVANGWLDYHLSTYSLEAPRAELQSVLELLAGRMSTPVLTQERLNKGILRTRELELSEPYFTSDHWISPEFEQLIFPSAGQVYKFGNIDHLERMTVADVLRWHEEGYAPNNSILVVVGDITLEEIQPLVQRMFGSVPRFNGFTPIEQPASQPLGDERRLTQYLDTPRPRLQLAFNTPGLATVEDTRDMRALQVISALLTKGPQAWLPNRLSGGADTLSSVIGRFPGYRLNDDLLLISVTLGEHTSASIEQVELEIKQLLEILKNHAVDTDTLCYGRQQALAYLNDLDTLEMQASVIGNLLAIGQPWTLIDDEAQQIDSITADDIQRVANAYFTPQRLSVAHVLTTLE